MSQTPIQKNIIHGSITAGGNVHIGDIVYNIERDFNKKAPPQYNHTFSYISTTKILIFHKTTAFKIEKQGFSKKHIPLLPKNTEGVKYFPNKIKK
jgi:hypothetical protein